MLLIMDNFTPIYIYPHLNNPYDYWISIHQVNLLKNMNLMWIEHIL